MKSDKSRDTFHPEKHFSSVRLQQGRVLTDADWNEQSDVIEHRDETTALDVIGQAGVPVASNGFQIDPFTDSDPDFPVNFRVNGGRMYVDGILCELDHEFVNYTTQDDKFFDPAMAESLAPFLATPGDLSTMPLPDLSPSGMVLVYADVWMRHIGVVEDPTIRETALGGPDTATRAKTVCQVKVLNVADADPPLSNVDELIAGLNAGPVGRMEAQVEHVDEANTPCIIPESAGFTRLENQLYRVEVHTAGEFVLEDDVLVAVDGIFPTFKWSRDNGSILAEWLADPQPEVGTLKVRLPTRDESRGFAAGQWVELTDDARELSGVSGIFVQLISPTDQTTLSYDATTISDPLKVVLPGGLPVRVPDEFHPKVRRWDMPANSGGPQQINPFAGFVNLESGVQIRFPLEPGKYRVGDYWLIPARTINNTIEFPVGPQFPLGIRHHFACLASFQVTSFESTLVDCRKLFNPLTDLNPTVQDAPTPGQFRYYLIDGDGENNAGGDANGKVGIDNNAAAALGKATPFLSIGKALSLFPRDGNGSHAIFLLRSGGFTYGDFRVDGVHGYRKIVIRGSSFENINTFDEQRISGASTEVLNCAIQTAEFPMNVIDIDLGSSLPGAPETPHVGQRVRFPETSSGQLTNFTSVLLGIQATENLHHISIGNLLPERPSSSDQVFLERPNVFIDRLMLGIVGTAHQISDNSYPSLSLVGLNVNRLECHGGIFGEIAFCQAGLLTLGDFDQFSVTGNFHEETGNLTIGLGAGLNCGSLFIDHGALADFENSASLGGQALAIDDLRIRRGNFVQSLNIEHCERFEIGAPRLSGEPRLIRLAAENTGGGIRVRESDGFIFSASLDAPVPIAGTTELDFDFTNGHPSITLEGVNRSVRLNDLQTFQPFHAGPRRSGIILDATGAVACTVSYDLGTGAEIPSGLILLPRTSAFRPFELTQTDMIDSADNHYLSPQQVSFKQKGFPFRKGGTESGYARYNVMRFVPDDADSNRINRASPNNLTGVEQIAGVIQQEFMDNDSADAVGTSMCVTTGYSLVRLDSVPTSITTPAIVVLSDRDEGMVTTETSSSSVRQFQIGTLVRIIEYFDQHKDNMRRLGLVRLDIKELPPIGE